jgi:hypothetical protein
VRVKMEKMLRSCQSLHKRRWSSRINTHSLPSNNFASIDPAAQAVAQLALHAGIGKLKRALSRFMRELGGFYGERSIEGPSGMIAD